MMEPSYLSTYSSGNLHKKTEKARDILKNCTLCPRKCGVNRMEGETGVCNTGRLAMVSSFSPHFGEEDPLVGEKGSGTIFFTHCNLLCLFCQNFDISHMGEGIEVYPNQMAHMMLELQKQGCHNINFVSPSHVVPQILEALELAVPEGLNIPLVYNTGGYDAVETLKLIEGVIDIYMPDIKFFDPEIAQTACSARDYPEVVKDAVCEMHRQVKDLTTDEKGVARKGLLVRHLVLPGNIAGTGEVMQFLSERVSKNTYVNIMSQYRPLGKAREYPEFAERPDENDFAQARQAALDAGITRLDRRAGKFRLIF